MTPFPSPLHFTSEGDGMPYIAIAFGDGEVLAIDSDGAFRNVPMDLVRVNIRFDRVSQTWIDPTVESDDEYGEQ